MNLDHTRIGLIGLGYVGLPLAVEFGKHYPTIGFDLKPERIDELRAGHDSTRETTPEELRAAIHLSYTTDPADLAACNVYIVTVPTPIDRYKRPDLTPLERASETVGRLLQPGDLVIYESTVYPGCTEEICVPILERESGLTYATVAPSHPTPLPRGERGAEPRPRALAAFTPSGQALEPSPPGSGQALESSPPGSGQALEPSPPGRGQGEGSGINERVKQHQLPLPAGEGRGEGGGK